jgi:hypothetical protein
MSALPVHTARTYVRKDPDRQPTNLSEPEVPVLHQDRPTTLHSGPSVGQINPTRGWLFCLVPGTSSAVTTEEVGR